MDDLDTTANFELAGDGDRHHRDRRIGAASVPSAVLLGKVKIPKQSPLPQEELERRIGIYRARAEAHVPLFHPPIEPAEQAHELS